MTTSHEGWVARLRKALQDGKPLDLSGIKGAREWSDDPAGRKWPKGATIPASALREVLVRPGVEADPRGLTVVGARVTGEIDLDNVVVGFAFGLVGCRLDEPFIATHSRWHDLKIAHSHVPGLNLDRARIDGNLSLPSLAAVGAVRALGATITGTLNFKGAHLTNKDGDALSLDGATIGGDAFLDDDFTAEGEVRALGATITGTLNLCGAHLTNKDGDALSLDGASIGGDAFLDDDFTAEGEVRALGATITGTLNLCGAHLTNKNGTALSLDRATIGGGVFLDDDFTAEGQVRALGATITGQLSLKGAHLTNKDGNALSLDSASIDAAVFLDDGFTAEGQIRALGATITGTLNLRGAHLTNKNGTALSLDRATIGGSAFLDDGFTAEGQVRALGATITGQLSLKRAHLTNKDGNALNLYGARIGSLLVAGSVVFGVTDLTDSHIECVVTGPKEHTLPTPVAVNGLRVDDIHGFLRSDGKAMREWLDGRPVDIPFSPGPWVRMAEVYRTNGHPEIARRLRYEAARRTTKTSPWWSKTLRRIYQVTVGFGHYPWITGIWLAGVFAAGAALAHFTGDSFTKVNATAPGTFSALSIAIETAIPAAGTLGATDWVSTTHWVAWTLAGLRVIAWVMTALMLAGVTGLLKKAD